MTAITEGARRIAWFVALWAAGVGCVGAVAYLIRWWLIG